MFRILLALPLAFTLLSAQAPEGPPRKAFKHEQVLAHLHRMRMTWLQQALSIPEEKARTIADRWARFDRDGQENRMAMRKLHREANAVLMSPLPEEEKNAKARPLVDQLAALQQQRRDLRRAFEDDVRAALAPAQQARFILLAEEFQRSMLEAIKRQRSASGSPRGDE